MSSQVPRNKQKPCRALRMLGSLEGLKLCSGGVLGSSKDSNFWGVRILGEQQVPHFGVFVLIVDPLPLPLGEGILGGLAMLWFPTKSRLNPNFSEKKCAENLKKEVGEISWISHGILIFPRIFFFFLGRRWSHLYASMSLEGFFFWKLPPKNYIRWLWKITAFWIASTSSIGVFPLSFVSFQGSTVNTLIFWTGRIAPQFAATVVSTNLTGWRERWVVVVVTVLVGVLGSAGKGGS